MEERSDRVSFKGVPMTLLGPELKVGDNAPDFQLVDMDLQPVSLADYQGKTKIICTVPSLDTPVCDAETRRFNLEASRLSDNIVILTVSLDLQFAQKRWCGAADIKAVQVLSDYRERSFGQNYGVLIKELFLLSRAIFVVDSDNIITYIQHVPEITDEPDYAAVLDAVRTPQIPVRQVPMDGICGGY
jgi:thiol peroxidase